MSVTPGAADSLQAMSSIVTVVMCYFSLQQLCICSAERCKHRGACCLGGFDRKREIDVDHPMTILIRRLLWPRRDWLCGQPCIAWSLFQEFGWGLKDSNELGLVSHLAFWQVVPIVT